MKIIIKGIEYDVSEYSELASRECDLTFYEKGQDPIVIVVGKKYDEYTTADYIISVLGDIQRLGFEEFIRQENEDK